MVYLESLVAIIVDQPIDSLQHLLPFATLTQGQRVYPNPCTGISTPLYIYLANTAMLIRQRRHLISRREWRSDIDLEISRSARKLYALVLSHRPPSATLVDDTQDVNTPLTHLFAIDTMLRLVILLELVQVFPEVVSQGHPTREVRQTSLDLAIAILTIVSDLPESSGANIMLSIPLLSAGSALQPIEGVSMDIHQGYDLGSNCLDGLCGQIATLMHRPATIQSWRDRVTWRVERLYHRVSVAPVKRISALLEAVWRQADEANRSDISISGNNVHWMDVMIEGGLETLFG